MHMYIHVVQTAYACTIKYNSLGPGGGGGGGGGVDPPVSGGGGGGGGGGGEGCEPPGM